jgi:hypothetical protein
MWPKAIFEQRSWRTFAVGGSCVNVAARTVREQACPSLVARATKPLEQQFLGASAWSELPGEGLGSYSRRDWIILRRNMSWRHYMEVSQRGLRSRKWPGKIPRGQCRKACDDRGTGVSRITRVMARGNATVGKAPTKTFCFALGVGALLTGFPKGADPRSFLAPWVAKSSRGRLLLHNSVFYHWPLVILAVKLQPGLCKHGVSRPGCQGRGGGPLAKNVSSNCWGPGPDETTVEVHQESDKQDW